MNQNQEQATDGEPLSIPHIRMPRKAHGHVITRIAPTGLRSLTCGESGQVDLVTEIGINELISYPQCTHQSPFQLNNNGSASSARGGKAGGSYRIPAPVPSFTRSRPSAKLIAPFLARLALPVWSIAACTYPTLHSSLRAGLLGILRQCQSLC